MKKKQLKKINKEFIEVKETNLKGEVERKTYTYEAINEVDTNFTKYFVNIDTLKSKIFDRLTLLNFIIQYVNANNYMIFYTNEVAKKFKVTRQTLRKKIQELEEENFITCKTNLLFLNPKIACKGTASKREYINLNIYLDVRQEWIDKRAKEREKKHNGKV